MINRDRIACSPRDFKKVFHYRIPGPETTIVYKGLYSHIFGYRLRDPDNPTDLENLRRGTKDYLEALRGNNDEERFRALLEMLRSVRRVYIPYPKPKAKKMLRKGERGMKIIDVDACAIQEVSKEPQVGIGAPAVLLMCAIADVCNRSAYI